MYKDLHIHSPFESIKNFSFSRTRCVNARRGADQRIHGRCRCPLYHAWPAHSLFPRVAPLLLSCVPGDIVTLRGAWLNGKRHCISLLNKESHLEMDLRYEYVVFFNCQVGFIRKCLSGASQCVTIDSRSVWTWPGFHLKRCHCEWIQCVFTSIDYAKTQIFPLYMWTNIHNQPFRCDFTTVRDREFLAQHACAGLTLEFAGQGGVST